MSIIIIGVQSGGQVTSCHLSPLDLPRFCLKQNFYLLVCGAWRLFFLGGQCYLLLFEVFVVFYFNQGLIVLFWLSWKAYINQGGLELRDLIALSLSAKSQSQKSSTGGQY